MGLTLERPDGSKENARVHLALAPLYPKLRTSAEELIDHSLMLAPYVDHVREGLPGQLQLEVFLTGGKLSGGPLFPPP